MSSVLVGMFDSQAEASAARANLIAGGFTSSSISTTGGGSSDAASSSTAAPQHEGGIARFFENLFGSSNDDADTERANHTSTYTEAFNRGSYGLTVQTQNDSETDKAEDILNAAGAVDVDERSSEWRKEGWTGGTTIPAGGALGGDAALGMEAALGTKTVGGTGSASAGGATTTLQEVQEELKVGKRAVARGGVRVFTRMTEVPVEESVTLREEHADIRRTAVDRVASEADLAAFKEGSIEIRAMSEEAVVSKTARVTGEVEVGKVATERAETIRDTVRQTKVDVEQIAAEPSAMVRSKP